MLRSIFQFFRDLYAKRTDFLGCFSPKIQDSFEASELDSGSCSESTRVCTETQAANLIYQLLIVDMLGELAGIAGQYAWAKNSGPQYLQMHHPATVILKSVYTHSPGVCEPQNF